MRRACVCGRCWGTGTALPPCSTTSARDLGNTWAIALALNNLADVARARGDMRKAHEYLRESLRLRYELGDKTGLADGLRSAAVLAVASREPQRAALLFGASAAMSEAAGSPVAPLY